MTNRDGVVHLSREVLEDGVLIVRIPSDATGDLEQAATSLSKAFNARGLEVHFLVVPYSVEILKVSQDRTTILEKAIRSIDKFIGRKQ